MLCPLCNDTLVKNPTKSQKFRHESLKCPRCQFVIFYRGIVGMDTEGNA